MCSSSHRCLISSSREDDYQQKSDPSIELFNGTVVMVLTTEQSIQGIDV
jgi:hypothetical protein